MFFIPGCLETEFRQHGEACAKNCKLNMTELVLTQARGLGGRVVLWKGSCVRVPALARLHACVPIMISTGEAYGSLGYIYILCGGTWFTCQFSLS